MSLTSRAAPSMFAVGPALALESRGRRPQGSSLARMPSASYWLGCLFRAASVNWRPTRLVLSPPWTADCCLDPVAEGIDAWSWCIYDARRRRCGAQAGHEGAPQASFENGKNPPIVLRRHHDCCGEDAVPVPVGGRRGAPLRLGGLPAWLTIGVHESQVRSPQIGGGHGEGRTAPDSICASGGLPRLPRPSATGAGRFYVTLSGVRSASPD